MILYGLKNCDTTQKAIKWLTKNKIAFEFHDYKVSGIDDMRLKAWSKEVGWEKLLNKKSTTWRELTPPVQLKTTDEESAIDLMKDKTSIIKRPLLEVNGKAVIVGFKEEEYTKLLM